MERKEWNKSNFFTESVSLRDILSYSDDDILNKVFCLYVDYETVVNNFDFFERVVIIMMMNHCYSVNADSYETVKFINDHLKDKLDIVISVLDDYENKSRDDIVVPSIERVGFSIPMAYAMWGIDFDDLVYVNGVTYHNNALNYNGNQYIDKDTLKKIRDIVLDLKSLGTFSELQIIILVSAYLQKNVEYLRCNIDKSGKYTARVDNPVEGLEDEVGLVETVLFKKYGLCTGIANSTTLLLNNPEFNINARTVFNEKHAFNIVKYNGAYYYLDNTWGITRSGKEFEKAIKPVKFNSRYILYGQKTFDQYGESKFMCDNPHIGEISERGLREIDILMAKKKMPRSLFQYNGKVIHPITKANH